MPDTLEPVWTQTPVSLLLGCNLHGPLSSSHRTSLPYLYYVIANKARTHNVLPALLKLLYVEIKRNVDPGFN